MISHCIDEAIRWSAGSVLPKKAAADVIKCIAVDWSRPHGPMRVKVLEGVSGFDRSFLWWWKVANQARAGTI
eukprot:5891220-Karenia_brevis.AAC.1